MNEKMTDEINDWMNIKKTDDNGKKGGREKQLVYPLEGWICIPKKLSAFLLRLLFVWRGYNQEAVDYKYKKILVDL